MSSRRRYIQPLTLGTIIHGIRKTSTGFAVIKVRQLAKRHQETVIRDGMTEQAAEFLAMDLNAKMAIHLSI